MEPELLCSIACELLCTMMFRLVFKAGTLASWLNGSRGQICAKSNSTVQFGPPTAWEEFDAFLLSFCCGIHQEHFRGEHIQTAVLRVSSRHPLQSFSVFACQNNPRWSHWLPVNKVFVSRKVAAMMTGHLSRKAPQTWKSQKRRH